MLFSNDANEPSKLINDTLRASWMREYDSDERISLTVDFHFGD